MHKAALQGLELPQVWAGGFVLPPPPQRGAGTRQHLRTGWIRGFSTGVSQIILFP